MRLPLPLQFRQTRPEHANPFADQASVRFKLRFTRSAQADTAFLPFQVSPSPNQTGHQVLELRELHLYLALMAFRTLRENVENQAGSVDHVDMQAFFQIALLRRRKRMIENHQFGTIQMNGLHHFVDFAAADIKRGIRTGTLACHGKDGFRTCRPCQKCQFLKASGVVAFSEIDADKNGFRHVSNPLSWKDQAFSSSVPRLIARDGTTVEMACL